MEVWTDGARGVLHPGFLFDPELSTRAPNLPWSAAARILTAHGLGELRQLRPLSGGQINRVFLVNGDLVLRFRPEERCSGAFLTEAVLFERLRGRLPVPEVLAVDSSRSLVPADYVLARRLPGESLPRAWLRARPPQRERWMAALAELLRALHAERFSACGGFESGDFRPAASWEAYFDERFRRRLAILRALPSSDRGLLDVIEHRWRSTAASLTIADYTGTDWSLVHRDLHFGNLLVNEGEITAILDFEAAVAGPPDYELDQFGRFCRWPRLFVGPELESSTDRADFAPAWEGLRRHYPELFRAARLAERLTLYSLEYDLAALRDCYTGRWGAEALRHVLHRIETALEGQLIHE